MVKYGYARVSTQDQKLDAQLDALKAAGCNKVYTDKLSGAKGDRQGLQDILGSLVEGDILVVYKLDRLARSLKQLIAIISELQERGIAFVSLSENIDTSSAGGKLIFHIFGALAEFESELISERTKIGLNAARARGRNGGRPKVLNDSQMEVLRTLKADTSLSVKQVSKMMGISKSTYYRLA